MENDLQKLTEANDAIINFEVARYLRLINRDVFGESYTKYYSVPAILGSKILDKSEGEALFDRFYNPTLVQDIDKVTAEQLLELFIP